MQQISWTAEELLAYQRTAPWSYSEYLPVKSVILRMVSVCVLDGRDVMQPL